jgi:acyl-CoA synthetase (AMP-forming)/AMP-acid ligase II
MTLTTLLDRFRAAAPQPALIWQDQPCHYSELLTAIDLWQTKLSQAGLPTGAVVALLANYSPNATALLLALFARQAIVLLQSGNLSLDRSEQQHIAEAEWLIKIDAQDEVCITATGCSARHELISQLRSRQHPGLILFTSGSSGQPKAVVHDAMLLLEKALASRPLPRTLIFSLLDHIAGVNLLIHLLANGGCAVIPTALSPDAIAAAVERHRVEFLPTPPTFFNLFLLSRTYERYDFSSLKTASYGSEAMPPSTLARLHEMFPNVRFQQAYGMTEMGMLRVKTRSSDSLWVKVDSDSCAVRVVDGLLELKAPSAMLGYLNAPSPFTADGWYKTGDAVELDGEWLRVLGRKSELINVGGQKVYPAEVESVLQAMDGVAEVAVKGEPNELTGNMVTAKVRLTTDESLRTFRMRLRAFCQGKLAPYKVPVQVTLVAEPLHSERFKKMR